MTSRRTFEERKAKQRNQKEIILIAFEGDSEQNYFNGFKNQEKEYRIQKSYGNQTDPVNLVKNLYNTIINKFGLEFFETNKAFCIFDLDTYKNKEKNIKEAIELCKVWGITPITSAPCTELWFLLHYERYRKYSNSSDIISRLKSHLSNYKKGLDIFEKLEDKIDFAIQNAKELEVINIKNGYVIGTLAANPNTEIYKLVEYLINHK